MIMEMNFIKLVKKAKRKVEVWAKLVHTLYRLF